MILMFKLDQEDWLIIPSFLSDRMIIIMKLLKKLMMDRVRKPKLFQEIHLPKIMMLLNQVIDQSDILKLHQSRGSKWLRRDINIPKNLKLKLRMRHKQSLKNRKPRNKKLEKVKFKKRKNLHLLLKKKSLDFQSINQLIKRLRMKTSLFKKLKKLKTQTMKNNKPNQSKSFQKHKIWKDSIIKCSLLLEIKYLFVLKTFWTNLM